MNQFISSKIIIKRVRPFLTVAFGIILGFILFTLIELLFFINTKWNFLPQYYLQKTYPQTSGKHLNRLLAKMDLAFLNTLEVKQITYLQQIASEGTLLYRFEPNDIWDNNHHMLPDKKFHQTAYLSKSNRIIYETTCSIDKFGRRQLPEFPPAKKNNFLLFFGCSIIIILYEYILVVESLNYPNFY